MENSSSELQYRRNQIWKVRYSRWWALFAWLPGNFEWRCEIQTIENGMWQLILIEFCLQVNPYISTSLGETVIYAGEKSRTSAPYFFTVNDTSTWFFEYKNDHSYHFSLQGKQWAMAPHRYCGSSIPRNYYSSSSTIAIRFKSDADVQKGGFKLMAKSSDGNYMPRINVYVWIIPITYTHSQFATEITMQLKAASCPRSPEHARHI